MTENSLLSDEASALAVRVECLELSFKSGLSGEDAVKKAEELAAFVGEDSARLTAARMASGDIKRASLYADFISG